MDEYFYQVLTPAEITQLRAETERRLGDANILNNRLTTTANMAKNLSPMANLGIMLGTLGGMWGANQYNNHFQKQVDDADKAFRENTRKVFENWGQSASQPSNGVNAQPTNQSSTPTSQPAPSNPIFSTPPAQPQYIDQAITPTEQIQTADQMSQQLNGENYQTFRENFPAPVPTPSISPREFNLQGQIFEQKLKYDDAQKKFAQATGDEERNVYKKVMDDAATNANLLRHNAQQLNWNTEGFNQDNTLGEAVQRMNFNRARGAYGLLDMPSSAAQQRDMYRQLVDSGFSRNVAREAARQRSDEFREANIQRLMEGINTYGLNPDGSINEFGQMLAQKLYAESPYADKFVGGYAMPKDAYNANAQMALTTLAQNMQNARQLAQLRQAREIADANLELNKEKLRLDWARFNSDAVYKAEMLKQNEVDRMSKSPTGRYKGWYDFGIMSGLSEEDAKKFAGTIVMNESYSKGGKSGSSSENSKVQQGYEEVTNILNGQLLRLQDALSRKDNQSAEEILGGIDTIISDPNFKNIGLLSADDYQYILEQQNIYRKVISGEMTYEEARKLGAKPQPSDYKGEHDSNLTNEMNKPEHQEEINDAIAKSRDNKAKQEAKAIADAEQKRKAAEIQKSVGTTGTYRVDNPKRYQEPNHYVTPKIVMNYTGNRIVTNWNDLSLEQRIQLKNAGYTGGGNYYAGR